MCSLNAIRASIFALGALSITPFLAFAGPDHGQPGAAHTDAAAKSAPDPYPLGTCPISMKKLDAKGTPVTKVYDGREVRFCCGGCPPKFEKDLAASMAALDKAIIADQGSLYPLKTSVVTGKELPAKPVEFVYGNRLVRVGDEAERTAFKNHADKFMQDLDKAVAAAQSEHYPLTKCPVSDEALPGDMGAPVDMVVGGRLIRLCCDHCKKDVAKDPAKFIAMVDAARSGKPAPAEPADKDGGHGHK